MILPVKSTKCFSLNSKPLLLSYKKSFFSGKLRIFQRQAVIKLIRKKKDGDNIRLIKNCWPISLLNIGAKLISKVLAKRIKKTVTVINIIKSNCLRGWNISKWRRSIDIWNFRNNGPFKDQRFAVTGRYRKSCWFCWPSIFK